MVCLMLWCCDISTSLGQIVIPGIVNVVQERLENNAIPFSISVVYCILAAFMPL